MIITKFKFGAMIILLVLAVSLILSNNATPDYGPIYGLKRLQENVFLKAQSSQAKKVDFESLVLDNRLYELKYLVENQKIAYLLSSSLRYSATAGKLVDMIKQNYLFDKIPAISDKFIKHQKIIVGLVAVCQKNDNTECKYIQDDANYLKLYIDELYSLKK